MDGRRRMVLKPDTEELQSKSTNSQVAVTRFKVSKTKKSTYRNYTLKGPLKSFIPFCTPLQMDGCGINTEQVRPRESEGAQHGEVILSYSIPITVDIMVSSNLKHGNME